MRLRRLAEAPAPLLVVGAAFAVEGGAALATSAFDDAGPLGFVWLRVPSPPSYSPRFRRARSTGPARCRSDS